MENRLEKRRPFYTGQLDFPLLFAIALLCAFGLVMLFSASYYYAQNTAATKYDGFFYLKSQAMYLAVGLVAMYVVSRVDYHFFDKIRVFALVGTLALMLLVLIPGLGVDRNGAQRWLKIPGTSFTFQPSELAKFALIVYMAGFMSRRPQAMKNLTKGVFPMLFIMGAFGLVLLLQKNMSMMVIMMMTGVVMLFLGGAEIKHLLLLAGIAVPILVVAVLMEEYRISRVLMFMDPWESTEKGAYQLRQALIALGAGGIFGQGLNFSRQKLLFLPYGESDFIFAIIGEELGFIGCTLLILAYLFIIYRGIRIAMRCKDRFGSLMAAGITAVIGMQAAINIAVATSSIPPTGQTLPFVSAGGTSLMIFLAAAGILLNISRNIE
ncbi:MAG: putative lipid II flippase FtsW [Christensenella sp.]|jgi:cell division protein FtsW|nr:putative lipid II flippase FtsW [Christensenella sp.]